MAYPALTAVSAPVSTGLATTISVTAVENQTFSVTATTLYECDATALPTTVPLGQSGPFVLTVDSEEVLCSSFAEGVCEVYQFEGTSGRGYNTTTLAEHDAGVAAVSLTYTSVQSVLTGGDVTSVFARTGAVVAGNADYL